MWSKDNPTSPGRAWLILLALGAIAGIIYLPSLLRAEFLNFDDNLFFDPTSNAQFAEGGLAQILHPGRTIANAYLPVSHLSLYLDYQLSAGAPVWPHLHSLILHVLAAWVLVSLATVLGLSRLSAFAVGSFFLVHPALVESVAWVSSRKDLLSGLLVFLSLLLVARNSQQPSARLGTGAVVCGVLALYSKATAIVLPGLAVLVCLLMVDGGRRRWWPVVALTLAAVGAGLHHYFLALGQGTLVDGDLGLRAAQVPGAYLHYFRVLLWPEQLNILYPEVQTMELFRARLLTGAAVLGGTTLAAVLLARSSRFRLSGLALIGLLIALAPFNTAVPASAVAAADRYLYLVVPAFALFWAGLGRLGTVLLLAACLPLAVLSAGRAGDFRDSERIWRRSLEVAPENAVARLNLSADLQRRRPTEVEERRQLLEQALEDARYAVHRLSAVEALRNLALQRGQEEEAVLRAEQGVVLAEDLPAGPQAVLRMFQSLLDAATLLRNADRGDEAEVYFARAAEIAPEHPTLLVHRASRLLAEALAEARAENRDLAADDPRWPRAEELLRRAFAGEPGHFEGHLVRGRWLQELGEYMPAMAEYQKMIAAAPERSQGYLRLADLYLSEQIFSGVESTVRQAIAAGVADPALQQRRAIAMVGMGQLANAKRLLRDYLILRPGDEASAQILAELLASEAMTGLHQLPTTELEQLVARIEELDPDNSKLQVVQGKLARDRRQWRRALSHLQEARVSMPADEDVLRMLAETHRDRGYELLGFSGSTTQPARRPSAEEKSEAMEHFRRFVELAPPELPTESAVNFLDQECARLARIGAQHFNAGDVAGLEAAETAFRRCVFLRPDEIQYQCQLGQVLFQMGPARLEEAERIFGDAVSTQRQRNLDLSVPLLLRIYALKALGRGAEADQIGRDFLANPGDAEPAIVEEIRRAIDG